MTDEKRVGNEWEWIMEWAKLCSKFVHIKVDQRVKIMRQEQGRSSEVRND